MQSESLRRRTDNALSSLGLLVLVATVYAVSPYFRVYFSTHSSFGMVRVGWQDVLLIVGLAYSALLMLWYFTEPEPKTSKSIHCLRALQHLLQEPAALWQKRLSADERLGLLSVLLKAFFAPLMVVWLFDHSAQLWTHGQGLIAKLVTMDSLALFNAHGFWFAFRVILFLDVLFFTLGYLVELPWLKNEIRSVDPSLLGWVVALSCYPPFNGMTAMVFGGGYAADFPQFEHPGLHVVANLLLLGLMTIYAWASVALNFKASNLTHRGIVSSGPYRYVRHPAYLCKNLAWWIGLLPTLAVAVDTSLAATAMAVGSMLGWSVIYYMRAVTEEDHLKSVDGDYTRYCEQVRWRFVPGWR